MSFHVNHSVSIKSMVSVYTQMVHLEVLGVFWLDSAFTSLLLQYLFYYL
jgi:hypothetical protein